MSTRSLNQIKKEIEDFARSHGQLYTAKFSKYGELLETGDRLYPAFYYDLISARKDKSELVMSFTGWIADLIHPERDNEADVWSDTMLIACDLLSYLSSDDRDYVLQDGSPMRLFTQATGDLVAGVKLDFTLRLPFPYDRCDIPTKATGFLLTEEGDGYLTTEEGNRIEIEQ